MFPQGSLSGALFRVVILLPLINAHILPRDTTPKKGPGDSKRAFEPYPSLGKDGIGSISVSFTRPTQLYGWKGCQPDEVKAITEAYGDFHTLATQPDVFEKIDWNHQAAKDFWGPVKGDGKVTDERKQNIQGKEHSWPDV